MPETSEEDRGAVVNWVTNTFNPWLESRKASNTLIIFCILLISLPFIGVGLATTRTILPLDRVHIILQPFSAPAVSYAREVAHAHFVCAGSKSIDATFYEDVSTPTGEPPAGEPPTPAGSVQLSLSDGRTLTLRQTLSADGARYGNPDESFVFWNVGNTATVQEGNKQSYSNCTARA